MSEKAIILQMKNTHQAFDDFSRPLKDFETETNEYKAFIFRDDDSYTIRYKDALGEVLLDFSPSKNFLLIRRPNSDFNLECSVANSEGFVDYPSVYGTIKMYFKLDDLVFSSDYIRVVYCLGSDYDKLFSNITIEYSWQLDQADNK